MNFKNFAAVIASGVLIAYLAPVVFKLQDVALTGVVVIGVVLMLVDLWQSLQSKGD